MGLLAKVVCSLGLLLNVVVTQDTPGIQFLGFGYDVLVGNPLFTTGDGDSGFRTNIFSFTHAQGLRTADGKWSIPDKTTSQALSACSTEQDVTIMNSEYAYQRTVGTSFDFDFPLFGASFSFSVDSKNIRSNTYNYESVFAHVTSTCSVYDLTMHMSDIAPLDSNFVAGVSALPVEYDEDAYMFFIRQFGTHLVYQMTLGGRWGWQLQFQNNSYQTLLDDSIDINLGVQMGAQAKAGIKHSISTDTQTRVMDAIFKNYSFSIGGDFQPDVKAWQESVRNAPMPLKMSLFDLSDLFTQVYLPNSTDLEKKRENMKTAVNQYCSYRKASVDPQGSCVPPMPMPEPKPTPVAADAVHRICVQNRGAYAMWFETISSGAKTFDSDTFPNPQSRCVDGMQLGLSRGMTFHCKAHIIAGTSPECEGKDYPFDVRSHMQANYRCQGSTTINSCVFTGLTTIGSSDEVDSLLAGSITRKVDGRFHLLQHLTHVMI